MAVRTYESIPGPKELPIVGSVFRRFSGPLQFFREMKETCGDAARFTLFREKFILFSHPALVELPAMLEVPGDGDGARASDIADARAALALGLAARRS